MFVCRSASRKRCNIFLTWFMCITYATAVINKVMRNMMMSKFFKEEQLINITKSLVLLLSFWKIQKEKSLERNERKSRILVTIISLLKKDEDSDRNRTSKKENRSWDYYDFRKSLRFFFFFFFFFLNLTSCDQKKQKSKKSSKNVKEIEANEKSLKNMRNSLIEIEECLKRRDHDKKCVFLTSFLIWIKSEENLNLKSFEIWENKLILLIFM
jgi:hypothetical protein